MKLSFYIHPEGWGHADSGPGNPYSWDDGKVVGGVLTWILQTYQYLKDEGYEVELAERLEQDGIVIAHRDSIPLDYRPHRKQFLVCAMADGPRHPYANFHVIQNPGLNNRWLRSPAQWKDRMMVGETHAYVVHWPQPDLILRSRDAGPGLRVVSYFGTRENLHPELLSREFVEALSRIGVEWRTCFDPKQWTDYSETDAVLAMRPPERGLVDYKPPSKLVNCWLAGVIPILGAESAYQIEGQVGLDYCEVVSPGDAIRILSELRVNEDRVIKMRAAGRTWQPRYSRSALCGSWIALGERWISLFANWRALKPPARKTMFAHKYLYLRKHLLMRRVC